MTSPLPFQPEHPADSSTYPSRVAVAELNARRAAATTMEEFEEITHEVHDKVKKSACALIIGLGHTSVTKI